MFDVNDNTYFLIAKFSLLNKLNFDNINEFFKKYFSFDEYDLDVEGHRSVKYLFSVFSHSIYIQNDFVFYFGKRNPIQHTAAYNQLGVLNNELFFGIRAGYRYVAHDTMLQGNLIGDSSDFLVEPNNHLLLINTELYFRRGRTDIKIFYNIKSSETKNTDYHLTMTLSIARNF